jgi:K+-sensing histidine kinase KdpD
VQLTDVIRAAVGEVEDYERVAVRDVEPATVLGTAASDVAHLLAELIENALVFSGPGQAVTVRGRHRHDGGYTLAVIDLGPGMPAPDLDAANRRLAGHESFTVAPSKYLGHYVAGNLAARHRIHVRLQSEGRGVTAAVFFPPQLLGHSVVPVPPVAGRPRGGAGPAGPPALAATPPSPARSRRRTS